MSKQKSKIGILGYGEVGQAIAKFYNRPRIKDLKRDDGLEGVEILNVCMPWSNNFLKIVIKEIRRINPKLVIIHSTVAPGTTKKLARIFKKKGIKIVHSPIRGIHPKLYQGIKVFVKYIGAEDKTSGLMAEKHLKSLGMKTKVFIPSINTELGKLLDTTYYGVCIAWHGEMEKLCKKFGADFKKTVVDFNRSYNEGYLKLGKRNVIRPVLYAPKKGIGGHCIIQNAEVLRKSLKSKAIDLVIDYKTKEA